MVAPKVRIDPPVRRPRKGGIKSVIGSFQSAPRLAAASNVEWISAGCALPNSDINLCYVNPGVQPEKTLDGLDIGTGPIFALYSGIQCYLGENTDYDQRARDLLSQGEDRGVEDVLWDWATTTSAPVAQPSVVAAIAEAEETADTFYLGQPVLIMSRELAVRARAANALDGDRDGNLWTANGTPVIATSAATDLQLSIIGWPSVYVSDVIVGRAMHFEVNTEMAIAERLYAIAVDCGVAYSFSVPAPTADPGSQTAPLTLLLGSTPSSPIPDGTDTTLTVHANQPPADEVYIHYSINGGAWQTTPELTQVTPTEYVHNVTGDETGPGDSVELYAKSGTTESNHIVIEVT